LVSGLDVEWLEAMMLRATFFMRIDMFADEIMSTTAETQALDTVPTGYVVTENEKTSLPLLKRG
jgi:hypothetical protein